MLGKENIILLLYKLKEKTIKKSKEKEPLKEIKIELKNNFNNLMNVLCEETRFSIEQNIKREACIRSSHTQDKLVYTYSIFATILGILDARYDDTQDHIKRNDQDQINLELKNLDKILNYRQEAIEEFLNIENIRVDSPIYETLTNIPAYTNFNKLFNDKYHILINQEVIKSYMSGYSKSLYFDLEDILIFYRELFYKLHLVMIKQEKNKTIVKKLILEKRD